MFLGLLWSLSSSAAALRHGHKDCLSALLRDVFETVETTRTSSIRLVKKSSANPSESMRKGMTEGKAERERESGNREGQSEQKNRGVKAEVDTGAH